MHSYVDTMSNADSVMSPVQGRDIGERDESYIDGPRGIDSMHNMPPPMSNWKQDLPFATQSEYAVPIKTG